MPRIGTEVAIEFIEGNIDRPLSPARYTPRRCRRSRAATMTDPDNKDETEDQRQKRDKDNYGNPKKNKGADRSGATP